MSILGRIGVCFFTLSVLSAATVAAAPTGAPIRVGGTVSVTGKFAEPATMIHNGYRLWADQINAGGGLLGRPVQLILEDDQSRPERVAELYEHLIATEKVDLVVSPYGTPLTLAAAAVTEDHGYLMMASSAAGRQLWDHGHRFVIGMYSLADRYFIGLCDLMARSGRRRLAILHEESPFNRDVAEGTEAWAKRFGLEIVLAQSFAGSDDLPGLVDRIRQVAPEGLILAAYSDEGQRFLEILGPVRPAVIGLTIAPVHPDFGRRLGPLAEGVFGASQWEPDERIPFPGTLQFVEDFKRLTGKLPSYHAGAAFAACQILERAIRHTGRLDQRALRDYVFSLDTVTVIGRFKVDFDGRQIGHNPLLIQWQDGRKQIVYPPKMRTAEPRL